LLQRFAKNPRLPVDRGFSVFAAAKVAVESTKEKEKNE
jgi:hypothetical protein